ncbi:hypothetical protein, partial [Actinomadura formosensis]
PATPPRGGAGRRSRRAGRAAGAVTAARLHALHSGHIGDYAAWLTAGVAVLALLTTCFRPRPAAAVPSWPPAPHR